MQLHAVTVMLLLNMTLSLIIFTVDKLSTEKGLGQYYVTVNINSHTHKTIRESFLIYGTCFMAYLLLSTCMHMHCAEI